MCMKINVDDDVIIVYLINTIFSNYEKKELINEIRKIFIRLIKYYHFKLKGIFDVNLYYHIKYGTILEIIKKDELLFSKDYIDIKLNIYKDSNFYFKTNDYYSINKYKNIYYDKKYFYININNIDNIINIIEYGTIIYKEKDDYLNNMKLIK